MNPLERPSKEAILAAAGKIVPDVIAPGLKVLFCGINPGLYSAAVGYHFARPGNRFWGTLYAAGFTSRLFSPAENDELLQAGYGITNLVSRATASADELTRAELEQGRQRLHELVSRYHPRSVAILGIGAYQAAFRRPKAHLGPQPEDLAGALVWLLPNPSGLNAHYQRADLVEQFRALYQAIHRA